MIKVIVLYICTFYFPWSLQSLMYYTGNKNIPGLIQKIVNLIPPCTHFYEPFAGSAAVSSILSLLPGTNLIFHINDIDTAVTANFNYPSGSIITSVPAAKILRSLSTVQDPTDHFIFLDPPYHESTRDPTIKLYKHTLSHQDHVHLLKSLLDIKCNCMIIHPSCDLYNQVLHTFFKFPVTVRYHRKTSHEILYTNYPRPVQLLTYAFTGKDCWDRQRIKRKGDRLINKLSSLPAMERNYLISRILNQFNSIL